jgi:hypothetical protein
VSDPLEASGASTASRDAARAPASLVPVPIEALCVTSGRVRSSASAPPAVETPQLRAVIAGSGGKNIALSFRFAGQSAEAVALASGEMRSQLGLKLLAQDTCNLLYVMWRSTPKSELVVSFKSNPGMSRHAQCGAKGYTRLRPDHSSPVPPLEPGSVHRLEASLLGARLEVRVDRVLVWEGTLAGAVLDLQGPVGLRSDNVRFDVLELTADLDSARRVPCLTGESAGGGD